MLAWHLNLGDRVGVKGQEQLRTAAILKMYQALTTDKVFLKKT